MRAIGGSWAFLRGSGFFGASKSFQTSVLLPPLLLGILRAFLRDPCPRAFAAYQAAAIECVFTWAVAMAWPAERAAKQAATCAVRGPDGQDPVASLFHDACHRPANVRVRDFLVFHAFSWNGLSGSHIYPSD